MSIMHRISFYHECGHSEDCIWSSSSSYVQADLPPLESTVLPRIDSITRAMLDEGNVKNSATELHYLMKKCNFCAVRTELLPTELQGTAAANLLFDPVIRERRLLWSSIIESFKIPQVVMNMRHDDYLEL